MSQKGQIGQVFANPKILTVIEGGFGAQGPLFLKILFDVGRFVISVQTGINPVLNHLGAKVTGGLFGHPTFKNELDPVGPPHIQIVSDDRFKPLPSAYRVSEDLGPAEFDLPQGEPIVITSLLVGLAQPPRQRGLPLTIFFTVEKVGEM